MASFLLAQPPGERERTIAIGCSTELCENKMIIMIIPKF